MADAALQAQIAAAVAAALAARDAQEQAPVAHVAVKLPEFWIKDPAMWFSQAEAQFRRSRITREMTKYDHVLTKLPENVIMSVRALISQIEANNELEGESYQMLKTALLASYGKSKWQMAYELLDHPDLGDRRPSTMMAEMLSLRYETSEPDTLFLALFLRRLPASIRDHLAAKDCKTAAEMAQHADILWDARNSASVSAVSDSLAAVSVRSVSPRGSRSPDRRTRSPDRRRDSSRRPRPQTPARKDSRSGTDGKICFYHVQYGARAQRCRAPCAWTEN